MRALAITQLAPMRTPSPSSTSPSNTQLTSISTSLPQCRCRARRGGRVGQAHALAISASAWRAWQARSSSASCCGLFTPATCTRRWWAAHHTPSATAMATMSVR
jgi:hypothetical protein